jgi:hypothetical protein
MKPPNAASNSSSFPATTSNAEKIEMIKAYYEQLANALRQVMAQLADPQVSHQNKQLLAQKQNELKLQLLQFHERYLKGSKASKPAGTPIDTASAVNPSVSPLAASAAALSQRPPSLSKAMQPHSYGVPAMQQPSPISFHRVPAPAQRPMLHAIAAGPISAEGSSMPYTGRAVLPTCGAMPSDAFLLYSKQIINPSMPQQLAAERQQLSFGYPNHSNAMPPAATFSKTPFNGAAGPHPNGIPAEQVKETTAISELVAQIDQRLRVDFEAETVLGA